MLQADIIKWNQVADALRESAAKLKQAQRIGKIGYWEHDLTADRITWSEETGRIFGLASFDGGMSQAQLEDMTHPDDRQLQRQALREALQGGRLLDVEFRIIPSDGDMRFVHVLDEIVYDESGRPIRLFGTSQDITERKQAEEELRRHATWLQELSRQVLQAQEVERRTIARELHDEIGQVLTAVSTNLQTIQLSPDAATLAARLNESVGLVDEALRQIRDLSLDLRPSMLDDFGLVPALEWFVDRQAQRSGFRAALAVEPAELLLFTLSTKERFAMHLDLISRLRQILLALALLLAATMALSACGAGTPAASTTAPKTPVRIQLAWVHEYSSASFYAADKHGYFAAQNLDVRLEPGGFGPQGYIEPIAQVVNGTIDFGVTGAAGIIQARAEGKPVVAIATMLQRSPLAILSLAKSGIKRPQDLIGRRVAVSDGSATRLFNTLLRSQQIDPATVNIVPRTTYGIDPIAKGQVDAMVAWVINEGVQLDEAGLKTNVMLLSDYGVDTYEMVLFTTEKMIAEHPDTVKGVVQATVQGMRDVIDNPDQAASLVLAYDTKLNLEGQRRRLQATLPLLNPAGSRLGMMQPDVWKFTQQMMLDQNVLAQPIDLGCWM